jgi:hypothetical protein
MPLPIAFILKRQGEDSRLFPTHAKSCARENNSPYVAKKGCGHFLTFPYDAKN